MRRLIRLLDNRTLTAFILAVSVFVLVTIKVGWGTPNLVELKIDTSWAWILAAALGGKAAQSFAELVHCGV